MYFIFMTCILQTINLPHLSDFSRVLLACVAPVLKNNLQVFFKMYLGIYAEERKC